MALTYKFIQGVQTLLSGDWKLPIQARIDELDVQLATSPESRLTSAIERLRNRNKEISEEVKGYKLARFKQEAEAWKAEKQDLEGCIARNEFKIGIEPMATIADAKQLLAHSHILRFDTEGYNSESVAALSNMLSSNFTELLDSEVARQHFASISYADDSMSGVIKKILAIEPVIFDDVVPVEHQGTLNDDQRQAIQAIIDSLSDINLELFQYTLGKMKFIEKFYRAEHNKVFGSVAISLSFLFSNKDAIDKFLSQYVDFTVLSQLLPSVL